jgi:hypothetical protein
VELRVSGLRWLRAEGGDLPNRPGPITLSRIGPNLAVSGRKPPDRDSVTSCPDLPFADRLTAQFAAPAEYGVCHELARTHRAAL